MKNIKLTILVIAMTMTGVSASVMGNPQGPTKAPPFSGNFPVVSGKGTLTIAGDNGFWQSERLQPGARASVDGYGKTGQVLPNGIYRYEYREVARSSVGSSSENQSNAMFGVSRNQLQKPQVISGSFTVSGGQVTFQ